MTTASLGRRVFHHARAWLNTWINSARVTPSRRIVLKPDEMTDDQKRDIGLLDGRPVPCRSRAWR